MGKTIINTSMSTGNNIVDRMFSLDLKVAGTGCYVPDIWYRSIVFENGKPNFIACCILSEIVYWYRPIVIVNQKTGQVSGIKKKFKADLLQKNYGELAKKFNISKQQVTSGMDSLEKLGVIKRYFRTVDNCGTKVANVLYIKLEVDRLIDITFQGSDTSVDAFDRNDTSDMGIIFEKETSVCGFDDIPASKANSIITDVQTNTDNSTNNTTDITSSSVDDEEKAYCKLIADNIHLEELKSEYPANIARIEMLYNIICDVVGAKSKTIRINKEDISQAVVKDDFLKIGKKEIMYVLDILNAPNGESIRNLPNYLKTILYNSLRMSQEHFRQKANNISTKVTPIYKNSFINFEQREYSDRDWAELMERKVRNFQHMSG